MTAKQNAPVFIVGSPRSGTTLLYHMLLSAGGFAVYRAEARVFDLLAPRFGDLSARSNREKLLRTWLQSRLFYRSGVSAEEIRSRVEMECRSAGDFLRILMESIAEKQGVERWAECTPVNVLYLDEIKRSFPQALVVHIIRDGRDVALSMERQGWVRPFPWDRGRAVLVAGLYWEWLVEHGRRNGSHLGKDYIEVPYENLVERPQETLTKLSSFIDHDLDHERIVQAGIGSVRNPNTSFRAEADGGEFKPVRRWEQELSRPDLAVLEKAVGPLLSELGYDLATPPGELQRASRPAGTRAAYRAWFELKHWLKARTPLGRYFVNLDWLAPTTASEQEATSPGVVDR
jgi:hypothetical protein